MNIFDADKLEKILVANWTHFLDSSKLMAYVLQKIQENASSLDIISPEKIKNKGVKMTLSRFSLTPHGFIIWVEFNAPLVPNNYVEGTMELLLDLQGQFNFMSMNGNII